MNFVPVRGRPRQITCTERMRGSGQRYAGLPPPTPRAESLDVRPATLEGQCIRRRLAPPTSATANADPAGTAPETLRKTDRRADQASPEILRGMPVQMPGAREKWPRE